MKLLLDTHTALWWLEDDSRLGRQAISAIGDPLNEVLLSAVVVWEAAIKESLGKLTTPLGFVDRLIEGGARPLPVTIEHASAVVALSDHHRDPFDRMLIAQSSVEGAVVVTRDAIFDRYGVPVIW